MYGNYHRHVTRCLSTYKPEKVTAILLNYHSLSLILSPSLPLVRRGRGEGASLFKQGQWYLKCLVCHAQSMQWLGLIILHSSTQISVLGQINAENKDAQVMSDRQTVLILSELRPGLLYVSTCLHIALCRKTNYVNFYLLCETWYLSWRF